MHQVFDEIGYHLRHAGYKGAKRTYHKNLGPVEVLVELEACESGAGFRIFVGTQLNPDLAAEGRSRRRVHDCTDCRALAGEGGKDLWPFHGDRERRIAMIGTLLRELGRIEAGAGANG